MLDSQRALFDIPDDVCYLNAAAWGPLPRAGVEAGRLGAARKGQPWLMDHAFARDQHERARSAAAALISAAPDDVALIPSVGYGVATAGKILDIPRGHRVLVLEDDHTSPVLEWMSRADAQGFDVEVVARPENGDWSSAVLDAISSAGRPPVSLASISSIHWADGGSIDLAAVSAALRREGGRLLVDATHAVGVLHLDVRTLDPDFVIFPTYRWLLGPYGRAFIYVAKRHQDGTPLEQTAFGRRDVIAENDVYFADMRYRPDARRFDMGERDHIISLEMASVGMELAGRWGADAISKRLAHLTGRIADGLGELPVAVPDDRFRAPHILCIRLVKDELPGVVEALAREKIHVAPRLGRMRISPHVYNTLGDADRLVGALGRILK